VIQFSQSRQYDDDPLSIAVHSTRGKTWHETFQTLSRQTRLRIFLPFFLCSAGHTSSEIAQTKILSVNAVRFPEMRESLHPGNPHLILSIGDTIFP
jgi:hypothetical protein